MPRIVARILLSILLMPIGAVVYGITFFVLVTMVRWRGGIGPFVFAGAVTWMALGSAWVALWAGTVKFTHRRLVWTGVAVVGAAAVGSALGAAVGSIAFEAEFGAFIGGVAAILLWLAATVLIWRETKAEMVERLRLHGVRTVVCPTCGYNLTGLRTTTCPECGEGPPLEELIARQPARRGAELGAE